MRTGWKFAALVIAGVLCMGSLSAADAASHSQRKKKKAPLPPLPSGPQGPVPQIPLDSIPAVAPQVSYQGGQLTIVAPNSTLADILRAVRKQTAAEIEIPANASERVVTHLGPAPAREVVAELLNGSRFNYVLLGSPTDASLLTRVVLVAKTGGDVPSGNAQAQQQLQQPGMNPVANMAPPPQDMGNAQPDATDAEVADENTDENTEQNAEADQQQQQVPPPEQLGIKTPQQMLQEMQQRQLQMQQQQQQPPGQPPIPGVPYPVPPQQPPQQQ